MRKLLLYCVASFAIIQLNACSDIAKKNTSISGSFTKFAGKTAFIEAFSENGVVLLDSTLIDNSGNFEISLETSLLNFYRLRIKETQESAILLLSEENKKVRLFSKEENLQILDSISGAFHSFLLHKVYKNMAFYEQKIDSIKNISSDLLAEGNKLEAYKVFNKSMQFNQAYRDYLQNFIKEYPSSPAVLSVLDKLEVSKNPQLFEKVKDSLALTFGHTTYYANLLQNLLSYEEQKLKQESVYESQKVAAEKIKIGKAAPEIKLKNLKGETESLSSLKGKYVLIDFWASWCKPCREENPNVKKLYDRYKEKGFEIFAVSLDRNKVAWESAVEADNLTWKHVSDLQFWNSAAAKEYGINAIPFTVLLDPDGIIIGVNLRGKQLENKLNELFNS